MSASVPTVLVVDDDEAVLSALRRALGGAGVRVLTTPDPLAVLWTIGREQVDVLISDLEMPAMTGLALIKRVRREFPDVVRILLTGAASLSSALDAINEGEVFRFLTKPWEGSELRRTVADALARREELRRASEAEAGRERRRALLAALEQEHPGITQVPAPGEAHVVDPQGAVRTLAALGLDRALATRRG
jgi:DNA-binding NtrC family response regulator